MKIRPVAVADYAAVEDMALSLHQSAVDARPDLYAPRERFYSPEVFSQWVNDGDAIWLLAEEDGKSVGICLTRVNDKKEMFEAREPCVDLLYVREAYRRRGIARQMLEEAERRAEAMGLTTLTLAADGYNMGAQRLYERFGMTPRKIYYEKTLSADRPAAKPIRIVPYDDAYRDDMIFMVLEAKNALGRIPGLNPDLLDISGNYLDKGDMFWLALSEESRVIGTIGYSSIDCTDDVWLHRFYIKAVLKRQGIGTQLYSHAEEYIKAQGKSRIRIHLGGKGYEASHAFYRHFGYRYDADAEHMVKDLL